MIPLTLSTFILAADETVAGMTFVDFLSSMGLGALITGVLVALINGIFNRGGKRADAAKALIDANQGFTATVAGQYDKLYKEMVEMKRVIIALTDTVDEILQETPGIEPELKRKLREANNAAKLAS